MNKTKLSVSKSDRCGLIAAGNYDLTIKSAKIYREVVKGKETFVTVEFVAVDDMGYEIYEKFRIADICELGLNLRDYRYDPLQNLMETILDEPVDDINEDNVLKLRGKSFNADVYHQKLEDGRVYPHINVDSIS